MQDLLARALLFFAPFFLSWLLNGTVDAEKGILFYSNTNTNTVLLAGEQCAAVEEKERTRA